ncbi:MAG TPA: Rieske (2Fe-2S) protein [Candidatus Binataceae bacterium]|nr:Rieske (2Fe-2S) protein [Candidatus Binataceae bacterium]
MAASFLCKADEVPPGAVIVKRLPGGQRVAVAHTTDPEASIVAFEPRCPHFQGPLFEGRLHGRTIVCPWHFFRFDLVTGEPVPAMESVMHLRTYPVVVRDGEVWVEIESCPRSRACTWSKHVGHA